MGVGDAMTVRVVTVTPKASVQEAITRMLEEGIGSVAVCDGPRLVGIFTERDVLRVAGEGPLFNEVAVENVMTPRPFTALARRRPDRGGRAHGGEADPAPAGVRRQSSSSG